MGYRAGTTTKAAGGEARGGREEGGDALRIERGCSTNNAGRMAYPLFRLDGLPIGSGPIESAADHVVQQRMQRAGMRRSDAGGDAVLALRARVRSGRPPLLPRAQAGNGQRTPPSRAA